jgi:mevalonate kinase
MKKWFIPAKTFLLGEYAALIGAPAIVLTTTPCFEVALSLNPGLHNIHSESPAGRWWLAHGDKDKGLEWSDPYHGLGGMGASSAQFIGAYLASMYLQQKVPDFQEMLKAYLSCAWNGEGLLPSGYDVIAQCLSGCVYIEKQQNICQTYEWPFADVAFFLLHTGHKLATHQHLQRAVLPNQVSALAAIVNQAKKAFEQADSLQLIKAVDTYYQHLTEMNLVAEHTLKCIELFKKQKHISAVKGCGALGADVLLLLVPTKNQEKMRCYLQASGWTILASSENLHTGTTLIEKNSIKRLEI